MDRLNRYCHQRYLARRQLTPSLLTTKSPGPSRLVISPCIPSHTPIGHLSWKLLFCRSRSRGSLVISRICQHFRFLWMFSASSSSADCSTSCLHTSTLPCLTIGWMDLHQTARIQENSWLEFSSMSLPLPPKKFYARYAVCPYYHHLYLIFLKNPTQSKKPIRDKCNSNWMLRNL